MIRISILGLTLSALMNSAIWAETPQEKSPESQIKPNPRDTTRPLAERLSTNHQSRILELIYVLRNYQVFSRDEEMAQAIYELHKMGPPTVPALIAELDRTDRDQTLRALGIAMRAMDDPRAVPALIRAVPKTFRPTGSDCGVLIRDRELLDFMLTLESHPDPNRTHVSVGRPVNEIHRALERLTGHSSPGGDNDPLRHVHFGELEGREDRRKLFLDRKNYWQSWWNEHGKEFLSADELAALDNPTPAATIDPQSGLDEVDQAGVARFGPLFPTGPGIRLGTVHEVELFSYSFKDAPCAIDFDRHRTLRYLEGSTDTEHGDSDWQRIDLLVGGSSYDLRIWVVDEALWDTIDEQIQKPEPLPSGNVPRGDVSFIKEPTTLLFTTREGSSGIMQLSAYQKETASKTIRYRLWLNEFTSDEAAPVETVVETDRRQWGEPIYMFLHGPAPGARCAWSIDDNKSVTLPENISVEEFKKQHRLHDKPGTLNDWKVANSVDFLTRVVEIGENATELDLSLLDSVTTQIRPQNFERMPVGEAVKLLSERSAGEQRTTTSFYSDRLPQPATYLFKTRNDRIGILEIIEMSQKNNVIKFRYKLVNEEPDQD